MQLAREEQARRLDSHDEASGDAPSASREKARLSENDDVATPTREVGTPQSGAREDYEGVTPRSTTPSTPGATSQHSSEHSLTEKARGKMKERRSSSLDMSPDLERLAAAGIGRNGFVPTQEWVSNVEHLQTAHDMIYSTRSHPGNRGNVISMPLTSELIFGCRLPLDIVMLVISELLPTVQELQASRKANSSSAILELLSSVNLKNVLPEVPPLTPRRFMVKNSLTLTHRPQCTHSQASGPMPR